PLWELWVVEGIEHGHIGFVAKIHHAAADGVAAAAMLANVLEAEADPGGRSEGEADPGGRSEGEADPGGRSEGEADPGPVLPSARPWQPEPIPSPFERLVGALRDLLRNLASLPGLLRRTVTGLTAVVRRRRSDALSPPL